MRKPSVGAHQFIWLLILTLVVFVVGLQNGKKKRELTELGGNKASIAHKKFKPLPFPKYPNAVNSMRIGDTMYMDGLPMMVDSFETHDSPDQIIAFYKAHWKSEGLDPYDSEESETHKVCGVIDKARNCFMTVTILRQDTGITLVFPSYSDLMDIKKSQKYSDIPTPESTLDRYKIDFDDFGDVNQAAQNDISLNTMSLEENFEWYKTHMEKDGWTLSKKEVQPQSDLLFMFFFKGQRHVTISVHYDAKNKRSAVLMNIQNS
jgi:hypothetical protein